MLHRARWRDLAAKTAYGIPDLRAEVFVVGQPSPRLDPDGADLSERAEHRWFEDRPGAGSPAGVPAYPRVADDADVPGAAGSRLRPVRR